MGGDCDKDSECLDGLKCGFNNCVHKTRLDAWVYGDWDASDDCCFEPEGISTDTILLTQLTF